MLVDDLNTDPIEAVRGAAAAVVAAFRRSSLTPTPVGIRGLVNSLANDLDTTNDAVLLANTTALLDPTHDAAVRRESWITPERHLCLQQLAEVSELAQDSSRRGARP